MSVQPKETTQEWKARCAVLWAHAAVHELEQASAKFGAFHNAHEGYAVLLEEVDELWQAVKHGTADEQRKEALQVAAMALRFLVDVYGFEGLR